MIEASEAAGWVGSKVLGNNCETNPLPAVLLNGFSHVVSARRLARFSWMVPCCRACIRVGLVGIPRGAGPVSARKVNDMRAVLLLFLLAVPVHAADYGHAYNEALRRDRVLVVFVGTQAPDAVKEAKITSFEWAELPELPTVKVKMPGAVLAVAKQGQMVPASVWDAVVPTLDDLDREARRLTPQPQFPVDVSSYAYQPYYPRGSFWGVNPVIFSSRGPASRGNPFWMNTKNDCPLCEILNGTSPVGLSPDGLPVIPVRAKKGAEEK